MRDSDKFVEAGDHFVEKIGVVRCNVLKYLGSSMAHRMLSLSREWYDNNKRRGGRAT